MEKLQNDENFNDEFDVFRNYGFNIDELLDMLKEEIPQENK